MDSLVRDLSPRDAVDLDASAHDLATAADQVAVIEAGSDGAAQDRSAQDTLVTDAPAGDTAAGDVVIGDDVAPDAAYSDATAIELGADTGVGDVPGSELATPDLGPGDSVVVGEAGGTDLSHLDSASQDPPDVSAPELTTTSDGAVAVDGSSIDAARADAGVCAYRVDQWTSECCGNFNESCCEGTTCTTSATCVGATCQICGTGWEYCCDGTKCGNKQVCGAEGLCIACGGNLQPCCLTGQPCTNVNSQCCIVGDVPVCVPEACI